MYVVVYMMSQIFYLYVVFSGTLRASPRDLLKLYSKLQDLAIV